MDPLIFIELFKDLEIVPKNNQELTNDYLKGFNYDIEQIDIKIVESIDDIICKHLKESCPDADEELQNSFRNALMDNAKVFNYDNS